MANEREEAEREIGAALALQQSGDVEGAARAFMAVLRLTPDDWRLADEAGNLFLYHLAKPVEAIACYEKALPLVEDATALRHKLGFAYATMGDDDAALEQFGHALRLTPTDAASHIEVAKALMRRGAFDDALGYLDTAIVHNTMMGVFGGGAGAHGHALALMNKARIFLVHQDDLAKGLGTVRTLLADLGDLQRCTTLAAELRSAGKPAVAAQVEALRDGHGAAKKAPGRAAAPPKAKAKAKAKATKTRPPAKKRSSAAKKTTKKTARPKKTTAKKKAKKVVSRRGGRSRSARRRRR